MKIEMIGYNDTKAIAIYGAIRLMIIVIISFIISLLFIVPAFVYRIYELLYIFIFPVFMIILTILQYFLNSNYKTYLKGIKTKHNFCLDSGILYKDGKERLFYSKDKTKIIYIYKNIAGSYSIGEERLYIADEEERRYLHEYGWWEPSWGSGLASFYGTVEEAFRDIETDIRDYIELK